MGEVLQRVQNKGDGLVGITINREEIELINPVPDFLYSCPEQPLSFSAHNEFFEQEKLKLAKDSPKNHYLDFGVPNYFGRGLKSSEYCFAMLPFVRFQRKN